MSGVSSNSGTGHYGARLRRFSHRSKRVIVSTTFGMFGKATAMRLGNYYRLCSSLLGSYPAGRSQSNETEVLDRLLCDPRIPRTFCEFGFDLSEFNCVELLHAGWEALLIDTSKAKVMAARRMIASRPTLSGAAMAVFLDRSNVRSVVESRFTSGQLGVLSIDVDGNDYWLLQELLPLRPALVVCEYNASFGHRPITVPYDPQFKRYEKHPSGLYHGASLTALTRLCNANGYRLLAVSDSGVNAFFMRLDCADDLLESPPELVYRQDPLRNRLHGTVDQQWAVVSHLPFVEV